MRQVRISKLMDEYTDTEFFPAGGSSVNSERVKARVLASAKIPTKKKQMAKKKKVLLVAALAAALVLLVGAGYPYIQHQLVHGTLSFKQTGDGRITAFVHYNDVVEYEDGRLIFNRDDGQRVDITDLVSEETPYIYDGSNPETGMTYYIIMGGTPEFYGWLEWIQVPYPFNDSGSDVYHAVDFDEDGNPVKIIYDFEMTDLKDNSHSIGGFGDGGVCLDDFTPPQWLLAAVNELGIPLR